MKTVNPLKAFGLDKEILSESKRCFSLYILAFQSSHHLQQNTGWSAVAWVQLGVNGVVHVSSGGQLGGVEGVYLFESIIGKLWGYTGSIKGLCPL